MAEENGTIRGACNCGAVKYEISAPPLAVAACHCTGCRKQSGAAFSVNLIVRSSTMTVTGELATFRDVDTESGVPLERQFCAGCGSPIRSIPGASPKMIAVKTGTLDDPSPFSPAMHLWTGSALPWVTIPEGVKRFERGPQA